MLFFGIADMPVTNSRGTIYKWKMHYRICRNNAADEESNWSDDIKTAGQPTPAVFYQAIFS
jgi:hypothetical protein